MRLKKNRILLVASLIMVAGVTSGCELSLPVTDCSWIDQPDMGGLVCLGANVLAIQAGAVVILLALAAIFGGGGSV